VGDFNGDGIQDLATANFNDNTVSILLGEAGIIPNPTITYPAADWMTDGLLAHYPFNGDATDQSGSGNDGTVNGPVLTTDRFGFSQSAYRFDGVDDSITWSDAVADSWFEGRTNLSLSLWIKPLVEESSIKKMFFEYGTSIFGLEGKTGPGQQADFWINNNSDTILSTTLDVGQWNHLVLQIDGANKQLYKNGELAGNVPFSDAILGAASFYLGRRAGWPDSSTHSEFDDLRIYDRALTAGEVAHLYTHTSSTGTLQFTPTADQNGTATITVTVEDGGLDNNLATPGDNASTSRKFDVTVNPLDDFGEPATASGSSLQALASLELSASFSPAASFTFTTADEPANEPDAPEQNLLVNQALQELTYQPAAAPPEQDLSTSALDDPPADQDIAASILEQVFEEVGNEL
jgi:hypothetical protein